MFFHVFKCFSFKSINKCLKEFFKLFQWCVLTCTHVCMCMHVHVYTCICYSFIFTYLPTLFICSFIYFLRQSPESLMGMEFTKQARLTGQHVGIIFYSNHSIILLLPGWSLSAIQKRNPGRIMVSYFNQNLFVCDTLLEGKLQSSVYIHQLRILRNSLVNNFQIAFVKNNILIIY